jgi:hypothetical protein
MRLGDEKHQWGICSVYITEALLVIFSIALQTVLPEQFLTRRSLSIWWEQLLLSLDQSLEPMI